MLTALPCQVSIENLFFLNHTAQSSGTTTPMTESSPRGTPIAATETDEDQRKKKERIADLESQVVALRLKATSWESKFRREHEKNKFLEEELGSSNQTIDELRVGCPCHCESKHTYAPAHM